MIGGLTANQDSAGSFVAPDPQMLITHERESMKRSDSTDPRQDAANNNRNSSIDPNQRNGSSNPNTSKGDNNSIGNRGGSMKARGLSRTASEFKSQSFTSGSDQRSMRQPPAPSTKTKPNARSGLTKSLLEQHDAYVEIDQEDEDQKKQFVDERKRKVRCNLCYNFKAVWSHLP